jgi:hypothetical protein
MRATTKALILDETVAVYSISETADDYGYLTASRSLVATVQGRIDPEPLSQATQEKARQERLVNRYIVSVEYNTDLAINYQLDINGKTYEIIQLIEDQTWKLVKRCIVSEVE